LVFFPKGFSQSALPRKQADSLWRIWKDNRKPDTLRLKALDQYLSDGYLYSLPDSAMYFSILQYEFAKSKGLKKQIASALTNQGSVFYLKSDFNRAIDLFMQSLKIQRDLGNDLRVANLLNNIGLSYSSLGEFEKAKEYYKESLTISEELGDKKTIANTLNNIGNIFYYQSDYLNALNYYTQGLKLREQSGDKKGISVSLNNIGATLREQGDLAKAIEYYSKSLKLDEETGNNVSLAFSLSNIGVIYQDRREHQKAIQYFEKSLKIRKELGDKIGEAAVLTNIGNTLSSMNDYKNAIDYHFLSLEIQQTIGDKSGVANSLNNIGNIYTAQRDYEKALNYYFQSIDFKETLNDKNGIASTLNNIGNIYFNQGKLDKSLEYNIKAFKMAKEVGSLVLSGNCARSLWETYKKLGNYSKSLEMHELYISFMDSVHNEEFERATLRQEFKYAYDKQLLSDSLSNAKKLEVKNIELAKKQTELTARRNQQFALVGVLVLVLIFSGIVYNRFKLSQTQKTIIEAQKLKVEEAHKEITDSISYAKRIQTAILPPQKLVKEYLPQSFVLYKPKDIVAGDFYWMEHRGDSILFAAADCTGHGVPGAMVSVVCNNGLNRSVREYNLSEPGKILDKTREIILEEFEKSEEEVKDGMDISLCSLNMKERKLEWSGANNPLWIIRKDAHEIEEIKANKQPIGKYADIKPFTTHELKLSEGDTVYVFTDGFQDQFGGEKGKKFKAAKFKELLLQIQSLSMEEQRVRIDEAFESWRGKIEQVDDVCVIGVRV
jgi:tetratricopeptide (TPR) repeat protein